jgi:hypothetical protein
MSKCYEVMVTARTAVFVRAADSEEQAVQYAKDELDLMAFDDVDCEVTELHDNDDIERSARHCGVKSEPS